MVELIAAVLFISMLTSAMIYPASAFAALVCVFGLEQWLQANSTFFASHSTYVNYASGIIVIVALISSFFRGHRLLRKITLTEWSILAFYALVLLSGIWTTSREWWRSTVFHMAPYVVVYIILLPRLFQRREDFRQAAISVIVFGGIITTMLLFGTQITEWGRSVQVKQDLVDRYGQIREKANPLAVGTLGSQVAIFAMYIAARSGISKALSLLRFGLIAVGFALVFRSESRGQLLALMGAMLFFLPMRWPRLSVVSVISAAATVGILGSIVVGTFSFSTIEGRFDPGNFAEVYQQTRGETCGAVLAEWVRQSPAEIAFGMGAGSTWKILDGTYPHVTVVQVLCELGIFGLAFLCFIFARTIFVYVRSQGMSKASVAERSLLCAFAAACLFQFVLSFKQGAIFDSYKMFTWMILLARCEVAFKAELAHRRRPQIPYGFVFPPREALA